MGGAAALQGELGLPVFAPANAVPILAAGLRMPLYRKAVWRTPRPFRAEPLSRRLLGPEGLFTYLSLGDFSHRNLVRALLDKPQRK